MSCSVDTTPHSRQPNAMVWMEARLFAVRGTDFRSTQSTEIFGRMGPVVARICLQFVDRRSGMTATVRYSTGTAASIFDARVLLRFSSFDHEYHSDIGVEGVESNRQKEQENQSKESINKQRNRRRRLVQPADLFHLLYLSFRHH